MNVMRGLAIPVTLALIASLSVPAAAEARGSRQALELVGRASVIDGDTLDIRGTRIRLWGVDAPESAQLCHTASGQPWRCGARSANALSEMIGTRNVRCVQKGTDRYRRVIGQCFVGSTDANAWLVASGWALANRQYSKAYVSHEDRARSARAGIHAGRFIAPWEYRASRRRR